MQNQGEREVAVFVFSLLSFLCSDSFILAHTNKFAKDNVTVNIDVALAFRIMGAAELGEDPDLVRKFVHELKPRGLEQQLRDAQDEAVRALARSLKHTEIYGIRSGENLKHIRDSVIGASFDANKVAEEVKEMEAIDETSDNPTSTAPGVLGADPITGHRDETLVGKSCKEDRDAARAATAAGVDVTDYM